MYAVVATGGKQLKVAAGDVVVVEKLDAPVGETRHLRRHLPRRRGRRSSSIPTLLAAATVTAEVVEHFKGDKAIIFKFKKRKGYKRLKGHRQELTRVRITDVVAEAAPAKKKAAPRKKKTAKSRSSPSLRRPKPPRMTKAGIENGS